MATVCEATSVVGSASTRSRATPKRKKIAGAAPRAATRRHRARGTARAPGHVDGNQGGGNTLLGHNERAVRRRDDVP